MNFIIGFVLGFIVGIIIVGIYVSNFRDFVCKRCVTIEELKWDLESKRSIR